VGAERGGHETVPSRIGRGLAGAGAAALGSRARTRWGIVRALLGAGAAALVAAAVTLLGPASAVPAGAAPAPPVAPVLSASVTPAELTLGAALTVAGTVREAGRAAPSTLLALQADAYPFRGYATIARQASGADGSFSFTAIRPDRNTRLRVVLLDAAGAVPAQASLDSSQLLAVTVDPRVAIHARRLGPGATRLSIRLRHAALPGSASVITRWYVAARGTREFRLAATTSSRELGAGLTYASATIDPPAKHFSYRVCLNPRWEQAMGAPASHHSCPEHGFSERSNAVPPAFQGEGSGTPVAAYPSSGAIAAASRYLDSRAGRTSFAVVNTVGALSGVRLHEHFETASVVKVMMLVAYLQMLNAHHRGVEAQDSALLYPMIHISDNEAASAVLAAVGGAAVARVARESGMSDYAPGVGWWAYTQTSAADQARFFFVLQRLIPAQFYGYARGLLSGIEQSQSWGVPPVARPAWQVFFKTGALPEQGLFTEAARLERPGLTFTLAVFTSGEPSMAYGEETIEGVAAVLLAHAL
jgi:Beta-lactamase enzyme family